MATKVQGIADFPNIEISDDLLLLVQKIGEQTGGKVTVKDLTDYVTSKLSASFDQVFNRITQLENNNITPLENALNSIRDTDLADLQSTVNGLRRWRGMWSNTSWEDTTVNGFRSIIVPTIPTVGDIYFMLFRGNDRDRLLAPRTGTHLLVLYDGGGNRICNGNYTALTELQRGNTPYIGVCAGYGIRIS